MVLTGRQPAEEMRHSRGQVPTTPKVVVVVNSHVKLVTFWQEKKETLEGEK